MAALQVGGGGLKRTVEFCEVFSLSMYECLRPKILIVLVFNLFWCDSLDAVDPLLLLLRGWGGDSVKSVVALDDAAVCLRLTGLDHLIFVVRDEELKAVLGESNSWVRGISDGHQPTDRQQVVIQPQWMTEISGHYRFLGVINFSDTEIFQGNNPPRFLILENSREKINNSKTSRYTNLHAVSVDISAATPPNRRWRRHLLLYIQSSKGSYLWE